MIPQLSIRGLQCCLETRRSNGNTGNIYVLAVHEYLTLLKVRWMTEGTTMICLQRQFTWQGLPSMTHMSTSRDRKLYPLHSLCPFHPASIVSVRRKSYHSTASGAVAKCHSAWASSTRPQGGKSNSSSAVAAVVNATVTAAVPACAGR